MLSTALKFILIIKDISIALVSLCKIWKGVKDEGKLGDKSKVRPGEDKGTK